MKTNIKKSLVFVGLTFFISYVFIFSYFALGGSWFSPAAVVVAAIYMFMPTIAAIVVQKFIYKEPLKEPLGISWRVNRWWLVAWLLPPAAAFGALGISLLLPDVRYSPQMTGLLERFRAVIPAEQLQRAQKQMDSFPIHPFWIGLFLGLVAGPTVNAVAGFGEELGWRGLLQRELGFLGFWKSSALIGFIWGLWHAPIILQGHNYPQHRIVGVFMMTAFCVLLAPVFSYVRLKAKSVIAAAIIHGSLNATAGVAIAVIEGGSDLTVGLQGLPGFITLAVINLGIFAYERFVAREPLIPTQIADSPVGECCRLI
jgi:membrane protease YdiL (CAAX protease family)